MVDVKWRSGGREMEPPEESGSWGKGIASNSKAFGNLTYGVALQRHKASRF